MLRYIVGWLLGAACIAPFLAGAQDAALPAPPAATAPAAIDVIDIPARADADERYAHGIMRRVNADDPVQPLASRLAAISTSIDERSTQREADELRRLPVARLESLSRHWKFDARRFDRWQEQMELAFSPYAQDAAVLARRIAEWEATRAGEEVTGLPAALISRMDAVMGELKSTERALSGPLSNQIELRRHANQVHERIEAGQAAVAAAINDIDRQLLRLDAPPLWLAQPRQGDDPLTSMQTGFEIEARFSREYAAADAGNQRALHIFQILLLPLLVWLALRSKRSTTPEQANDPSVRVLRRPISSWILLAMMGVLALEPDAPLMVQQVAMLLALVPVLRLLPPEGRRLLGVWPYAATALFVIERLGYLLSTTGLLYRVFHLGLATLSLLLSLWLLWRGHRRQPIEPADRLRKGARAAAWISVALFIAAIVLNLVGNVSLAETLTSGVISSGYLALMIYAGTTVAIALLQSLLTRPGLTQFERSHAPPLVNLLIRLLLFGSAIGWVVFTMYSFRIYRPVYGALAAILGRKFTVGEISLSLGNLLIFVAAALIAVWTARVVRLLLHDDVLARMSLPRGVGNSIASLTYYALLLLGLLVALSAAGFKVSQLVILFSALGVGIGFGLQNVVNNFVSGLILMFERPIQPGDVVDVAGISGSVRVIGMRATTIRTFDGADVVVPNGSLLAENLTNWTLLDRNRRFEVNVGVAYGSEPPRIIELLQTTAAETPGIAAQPAPVALFKGFGASSLDFVVRAWTYDFDAWVNIRSDLTTRIYAALDKAGIEIPFPQQDLHVRTVSDEAGKVLGQPR